MTVEYVPPMLAHNKPADLSLLEDDMYWAQEKLDGERRLFFVADSFHMTGRRLLKNGDVSDVIDKVPHILEHPICKLSDSVFDGELMHPKGFQSLAKVMRSSTEKALDVQADTGELVYHVYDILFHQGVNLLEMPYQNRYDILKQMFHYFPKDGSVVLVPSYTTTQEKKVLYASVYADETKEGLMFRNRFSTYQQGKRSPDLLRLKKEFTEDVFITALLPSTKEYTGKNIASWSYWQHPTTQEKREGERPTDEWEPVTRNYFHDLPGAFAFAQYDTDGNVHVLGNCSGFEREVAEDMKANPGDWLDHVVEIKANERFASNHFRHPRFLRRRDDKNKEQCIFEASQKE